MKISPKRASGRPEGARADEPLLHWWMPLAGLVLAAGWGAWEAADDGGSSFGDKLASFIEAIAWPGLAIFAITTFLVWLAWKVDLD